MDAVDGRTPKENAAALEDSATAKVLTHQRKRPETNASGYSDTTSGAETEDDPAAKKQAEEDELADWYISEYEGMNWAPLQAMMKRGNDEFRLPKLRAWAEQYIEVERVKEFGAYEALDADRELALKDPSAIAFIAQQSDTDLSVYEKIIADEKAPGKVPERR